MSRKRPWYKRYPDLFLAGTMSLTVEQKGAYSTIIDLIYSKNGPVADNPVWLARVCGTNTRRWKRIRKELIALGHLRIIGESLANDLAIQEIDLAKINDLAVDKKKKKKITPYPFKNETAPSLRRNAAQAPTAKAKGKPEPPAPSARANEFPPAPRPVNAQTLTPEELAAKEAEAIAYITSRRQQ